MPNQPFATGHGLDGAVSVTLNAEPTGRVVYAYDRPSWDATSPAVPNFDSLPP